MRATLIILLSPLFDDPLCIAPISEDPTIQTVAAKRAVEALNEGTFSRTAGGDVERVTVTIPQPLLEGISDKFGAIVATQVGGSTVQQK